jgi:GAF domain-containing protein/nitrogen-specific signal transduction histidine kinase
MPTLPPALLGLALLLGGAALAAAAWLAARPLARWLRRRPHTTISPPLPLDLEPSDHAVIVARPGGRVDYVNERGRVWFQLDGEAPDLDRMAQAARPRDLFLELFADEGRARLSIADRPVDAVSNRVALSSEQTLVITLQPIESAEQAVDDRPVDDLLTVDAMLRFSQAITERGTVAETARAILGSISELLPIDMLELNLWDESSQTLRPFRAASDRRSQFTGPGTPDVYHMDDGLTGWLARKRQSLFVPDFEQARDLEPKVDRHRFPFHAYVGVPLQFGNTFIGTLEIAHSQPDIYDQRHRMLLELAGAQVAAALHNAELYESHQRTRRELVGLSQLAHALTAARGGEELFEHLAGTVARMLEVEIAGYLTFDPNRSALIGQVPFVGLPATFVQDWLRLPTPPGGPGERWLLEGGPLSAADPLRDSLTRALKLDAAAKQADWGHVIIAPVRSSGKPLGALLAAWGDAQPRPTADAVNLASILAAQSAALIENAQLVDTSRDRARQADALQRVSGLTASARTLDEILIATMDEMVSTLQADFAVILLRDESGSDLRPHGPSAHGLELDELILAASSDGSPSGSTGQRAVQALAPVTFDRTFDTRPPTAYADIILKRQVASFVAIPILWRKQPLGEILIGLAHPGGLGVSDIDLAGALAGQVAGAVQRARLADQTDASLRQRVDQLTALTRISQELNDLTDLPALMRTVHAEAARATGADCGWTALFPGFADPDDPEASLVIGDSPEHPAPDVIRLRQLAANPAVSVSDGGPDELGVEHEDLVAAMAIPIHHRGRPAGLVHLHSRIPGHFDDASLRFGEGLASQAASAIDATERHRAQDARLETSLRESEDLVQVARLAQRVQPDQPIESILSDLALILADSIPSSRVEVLGLAPHSQELNMIGWAGEASDAAGMPSPDEWAWGDVQAVVDQGRGAMGAMWLPGESIGLMPLYDRQNNPLGLVRWHAGREGASGAKAGAALLEVVAGQMAAAIENNTFYADLHAETAELERVLSSLGGEPAETDHAAASPGAPVGETQIQTSELAAHAQRIVAVDRISRVAGDLDDEMGIFNALSHGCRVEFEADVVLIAGVDDGDLRLRLVDGDVAETMHLEPLFSQFNPMRSTLRSSQPVVIRRVPDDRNWGASPLLRALEAQSAVSVAVPIGDSTAAIVLLIRRSPNEAPFTQEDASFLGDLMLSIGRDLSRAQLLERVESRLAEGQLLLEFGQQVGSLDAAAVLDHLADGLRRAMSPTQAVTICLWDPDIHGLRIAAQSGYTDPDAWLGLRLQPGEGLPGKVYASAKSVVWDDVDPAADLNYSLDHLESYHRAAGGLMPASALGVPLPSETGILGTITLENFATTGSYDDSDAAFVASLASQAALTVQNARLYQQAQQSSQVLEQRVAERTEELAREHELTEALLRITAELASSLDLDRVLNRALALVNEVVGADRGVILLLAPDSDQLVLRAAFGTDTPLPQGGRLSPYARGEGLAGWVIEQGESVLIKDLPQDERWVRYRDPVQEHRSALAVPLVVSEDAIGAMLLFSAEPYAFDADQLRLLTAAGHQVAAAVNNAELYRLIRDQAERLGVLLREQQVEASKSRAILESIADGVIVTDPEHRVVIFNSSAEKILNLDRSAAVDRLAVDFIGVYGAAGKRWAEAVESWRTQPAQEASPQDVLDERLELDDGRIVAVSVAPVILGDEFLGTVSIFRDITREVEVDRLKSEFVATVSHELRTPMTSVKGYVEMLLMGAVGSVNDEQRRFLQIIKGNIDRLGGLVNDLLDISRIESGRVALSLEAIDVGEMLADVREAALRRSRIESKPLEIELDLAESLPPALADRDRLRQIINNLVENSFNYTPAGGNIKLRARVRGDYLELSVSDNGIGILPEDMPKVFERFYRGEQALNMSVAGTGLGLSIVRQLVEMHGGEILIQSDGSPGKGTLCTITLPIAGADD